MDNGTNGRPRGAVARGAELRMVETRTIQVGSVVLELRRARRGDRWTVREAG